MTGDLLDEPDETFAVNLTAVSTLRGGLRPALIRAQGIGTIIDDDTAGIAILDVTVDEADSGSVDAVFTVSLTRPSSETLTVVAQTADGTATAGVDYTAVGPVTLTFPAGTISQTFTVPVLGDLLDETDETFVVNLSAPSLGRIARSQGLATIRDDDTAILSVDNVAIVEGDTGQRGGGVHRPAEHAEHPDRDRHRPERRTRPRRPAATTRPSARSHLTFAAGRTSQTVTVPILGDIADEPNETFTVNLSNPTNAAIRRSLGRGTIVDNDGPPVLAIGDVTVVEGRYRIGR